MASASTKNRLRLASEIQRNGRPVDIPCDRCFLSGHTCIAMANASRLRCSECVRLGRPCVNLSWDSLDRTREEYQRKVDEDEAELSVILARLMRNKKILRQAEHRAERKALCLSNEMEATGELESVDNCPAADAGTSVSPAVWSTINFLDEAVTGLLDPAPHASVSGETRQSASAS
jgi:hypothetical protein